jgi:hypothetical protein
MLRLQAVALALVFLVCSAAAAPERAITDPAARALIEADWAAEATPQTPSQPATTVTTQEDAAGGNDGVINGGYGFHCASGAANSWWQVDLQQPYALDRVVVYNRCGGSEARAAKALVILVSNDGKTWEEAHKHDGSLFHGFPDKNPLVIRFADKEVKARFVRLQERAAVSFHLDEVEVYPKDNPQRNIALGKPADQSGVSQFSTRKPGVSSSLPPASSPLPLGEGRVRGNDGAQRSTEVPHPNPLPKGEGASVRPLPGGEGGGGAAPLPKGEGEVGKLAQRGHRLLDQMRKLGVPDGRLAALARRLDQGQAGPDQLAARWALRDIALSNPLLGFDKLLFVKRHPCFFAHMCDQYYGSLMQPGGGLFILENVGRDFRARDLVGDKLPPGNFLSPDLSYDAAQIVFAYTRSTGDPKKRWTWTPDVSYHLYMINVDGTGLRQLTDGPYDDIHPRFLPDGGIVFVSTRRGGYCRCGARPVPTYTLHRIEPDASGLRRLSVHETNEWHPCVLNDGRIVYTRWDYVDRHTNLAHSLWTTNTDGTNAAAYYGNYNFEKKPWGTWHPMAVPGSRKVMAIAGAHHGFAKGAVMLLDPDKGHDGLPPVERLTPEVTFPEAEGWPGSSYATPYPLSEDYFLVSYSPRWAANRAAAEVSPGIYLQDRWGHRELLYRDPAIASMSPIPLRPRPRPIPRPLVSSPLPPASSPLPLTSSLLPPTSSPLPLGEGRVRGNDGAQRSTEVPHPNPLPKGEGASVRPLPAGESARKEGEGEEGATGRFLLLNVYDSTDGIPRGSVKHLRIVQVLPKTTIVADQPKISAARQISARQLLGTVPVEADGSAHFAVPAGIPLYFQAVDAEGMAVQSMRSITYVQPGETLSCAGCHEPRHTSPPNRLPLAAMRPPSEIAPGPDGSMPFSYPRLVQPVLDKHCVSCHGAKDAKGGIRLTGSPAGPHTESYRALAVKKYVHWFDSVNGGEWVPRTYPGKFGARASRLIEVLRNGPCNAKLSPDDFARLCLWIDLNVPFYGVYEPDQVAEQLKGATVPLAAILK